MSSTSTEISAEANWWTRPAGGRDVLRLALPLILSTASWSLLHFVDRLMLTWHSTDEVAAALPSGNMVWTLVALPLGIASYVNTFVAQYHGSQQPHRIGSVIQHGILFGLVMTPIFLLFIPLAEPFFTWMGHTPNLVKHETLYFQINCWGVGGSLIVAACSAFFTGRGESTVVMWIDLGATAFNAVGNYLLIFGKFGCPEMGIAGAALATVASHWLKVLIYALLLWRVESHAEFGLRAPFRFDGELAWRMLRFGAPNGSQMLLEGSAFTVFVLYIGGLGEVAAATTTVAFSINILSFVPMFGLGVAVSTLVGQYLGNNQPQLAARATWTSVWIALAYNAPFVILYLATPGLFTLAHELGATRETIKMLPQIRELNVVLLRFVAAYCLFDAVQLMYCSAIKGASDTRYVFLATIGTSGGAVLIGWLGAEFLQGKLLWWWSVLTLWVVSLAVVYAARFFQGKWKSMRVIEPM